ncbi:MAG: hypothetical protein RR505_02830 [Raoultibacter sp.]
MDAKAMIEKYHITLVGKDRLHAVLPNDVTDAETEAIKAAKPEVLAYFEVQAKREARVAAITGLAEMREYKRAINAWHHRHQHALENEDYAAFGPAPERPSYPEAEAYLALESMSFSGNSSKAIAGEKGIEAVKDGMHPSAALEVAEKEWSDYCAQSAWN